MHKKYEAVDTIAAADVAVVGREMENISVERIGVAEDEDDIGNDEDSGEVPQLCTCPHCKENVTTHVTLKSSWLTYTLSCFFVLVLGWISFCVLPFLWPVFQDTVHSCPRCLNTISRKKRVALPAIKKEIITFRCGHCAVVLSRKYVILLLVMASLIIGTILFRTWARENHVFELQRGEDIRETWGHFLADCGSKGQLGNPVAASNAFEETYAGKTIKWRGNLDKVQEGIITNNLLYITMEPSPNAGTGNSDILLFYTNELTEQVSKLDVGDYVEFEATMVQLGRRGQPHLAKLWNVHTLQKLDPEQMQTMPSDLGLFGKLMLIQQLQNVMNGGSPNGLSRTIILTPRMDSDDPMDMPSLNLHRNSVDDDSPMTNTTFGRIGGDGSGMNGFFIKRSITMRPSFFSEMDDDEDESQEDSDPFAQLLKMRRQSATKELPFINGGDNEDTIKSIMDRFPSRDPDSPDHFPHLAKSQNNDDIHTEPDTAPDTDHNSDSSTQS